MTKLRIIQVCKTIVLIILCIFIGSNLNMPRVSDKKFEDVQKSTLQDIELKDYVQMSNQEIKRFLNINPQEYENIIFSRIDDPMQADEIVIVQFKSVDQGEQFKEKMKERMVNQKNIYDGYAPDEAKLIDQGIVHIHANYALYVVGNLANDIDYAFEKSLK